QADVAPLAPFGEEQCEARRAAKPGGTEILQELQLQAGVSARSGNDRRAEALAPVVQAEPAREEAVAIGHVQHVVRRSAGRRDRAGADVREDPEIAPRVR